MGKTFSSILSIGSIVAAPFTAGTSLAWLPTALGAGAAVAGALGQQSQENQLGSFTSGAYGNEQAALGDVSSLAQQEANGIPFQTLLDVQRGGVNTLKSQLGGIPNAGNLLKEMTGQGYENALESSINTRNSGLNSAINAMLGVGGQYGNIAGAGLALSQNQPNPWLGAYGPLSNLAGLLRKPGVSTPTTPPPPNPGGTVISGPDTPGANSPISNVVG